MNFGCSEESVMRRKFITRCLSSAVAIAAGPVLVSIPCYPAHARDKSKPSKTGIAAKEKLAVANAAARKWQKDAILVGVETKTATPVGTAYNWMYLYNSPSIKQQIALLLAHDSDETNQFPSPSFSVYKNEVGDFVDSEQAMIEAMKNGLKTNKFGMSMSLRREQRTEWRMLDDSHFYYVDAGTGKFLRKEKT
jgi:hypothetical protein